MLLSERTPARSHSQAWLKWSWQAVSALAADTNWILCERLSWPVREAGRVCCWRTLLALIDMRSVVGRADEPRPVPGSQRDGSGPIRLLSLSICWGRADPLDKLSGRESHRPPSSLWKTHTCSLVPVLCVFSPILSCSLVGVTSTAVTPRTDGVSTSKLQFSPASLGCWC